MSPEAAPKPEWFDDNSPPGLRFSCTMCGNCCTGPEGYVLFSHDEGHRLAERLGVSMEDFLRRFTKETSLGRSLSEKRTPHGLDCIFLDREKIPGKAVCGVYEDRPEQCRTWPFWREIIQSRQSWDRAKRTCPGLDRGPLVTPVQIRILRDKVP